MNVRCVCVLLSHDEIRRGLSLLRMEQEGKDLGAATPGSGQSQGDRRDHRQPWSGFGQSGAFDSPMPLDQLEALCEDAADCTRSDEVNRNLAGFSKV